MAGLFDAVMQGRQLGQQNRLAQLASQSYSTEPEGRDSLLSQMAQISPQAAQSQQQQFQQGEDRTAQQLRGYVEYVNKARSSNNPMAVNAALRAGAPLIQRLTGKAPPTEWTPDMDAGWAELEALVAMSPAGAGGAGVQSTYVDGDGNRVAIMRDGSTQILGKNDAGATQQTISITGPDGRPAQYTFDRRTGNYVPAGASMGAGQAVAPQVTRFTAPDGMQVAIGDDIDPAMRDAIMQYERGLGAIPDGTRAQLPDRPVTQFSAGGQVAQAPQTGSPFVGQSPAERAAAEAAARAQVELAYAPEMQRVQNQGAIEREVGVAGARAAAERGAAQAERSTDANNTLDLLAQAEPLIDRATGSLIGSVGDTVAGAFGRSTEGAQATAALQTLAGQLIGKMPRFEGPQSDKDVLLYRQMAGDLANSNLPRETRKAALAQIRQLNEKAAGQQSSSRTAPTRVTNAEDYNRLPSGATYIDPNGAVRRKR